MNAPQLIFECIWDSPSAPEVASVVKLWLQHGALSRPDMIEDRSRQIVYVIKDHRGEVGGVSTARPVQVSFLNNHYFYEFRCFIAPNFRAPGLDTLLALKTKQYLESVSEPDSRFKGILMIVENEELKQGRTKAVWSGSGMVLAGYTRTGHHIRVGYFKGARI